MGYVGVGDERLAPYHGASGDIRLLDALARRGVVVPAEAIRAELRVEPDALVTIRFEVAVQDAEVESIIEAIREARKAEAEPGRS